MNNLGMLCAAFIMADYLDYEYMTNWQTFFCWCGVLITSVDGEKI